MTALLALLMALNAFAIDAMIPALPDIGRSLHVAEENRPPAGRDRLFPRLRLDPAHLGPARRPLRAQADPRRGSERSMPCSRCCAGLPSSFALLIAGRIAMGASAAVTRVLVISMVRDLFEAESMARVMSLVFMTFMLVPVLAPNIGQAILLVAPWRAIFIVLAALCAGDARLVVDPAARDASPRISPLAHGATMAQRDARDRPRAPVARLHAGDDGHLRRADRLHLLDPADRLRSVRRAEAHRPGVRRRSPRRWRSPPTATAGSSSASGCAASATSARCFLRW